jgi:hypothetical protein
MRTNNVRRRLINPWLLWLAAALGLLMGCGRPGPEDNSGRDSGRGGALGINLDTVVTDAVNFEGGDATDWKKFELSQGGPLTVDIFWDNTIITGSLSLHDQYGASIANVSHNTSGQHDQLTASVPSDGLYYIRIHSSVGRSTYSVRVYTGPPREQEQWQEEPRPEFDRPI